MEKQQQYLFIDFEFTMPEGKSNPSGFFPEIIEVGYAAVVSGQITEEFSSFVAPETFTKLTERCRKFLQISQEQVDTGMAFKDLADRLARLNSTHPTTVVTWGNMDMKVLRSNCQKTGTPFPFTGKQLDLSMEYKRFFGDQNQTGLWKAVQAYGKEGTGRHHRALDDAKTTYNIFKLVEKDKSYMKNHQPTTIGDRVDLSKVLNHLAL